MGEAGENMEDRVADATSKSDGVPPGYKRTEGGVIPEDWRVRTIGAVAEIRNGGTPSTQNPTYWNGTIAWCIPTDITGAPRKYLSTTERRITAAGLANSAASMLPAGSLLLCSRATIGEVRIATIPICTNQGFKPLVCKGRTDNEFLYYILLTLKSKMVEKASGSTFLEISKGALSSVQFFVPPPTEQRAIADALSDVDGLLESLDALIAKKRAVRQAAMQQLLTGKTRLPGFSQEQETQSIDDVSDFMTGGTPSSGALRSSYGNSKKAKKETISGVLKTTNKPMTARTCGEEDMRFGYKRTEVGVIPEDWDLVSVEQLFTFHRTASNSRADLDNSGIVAYVHYGDLHTRFDHYIDFSRNHLPRLSESRCRHLTATLLRDGDLVVADASEDLVGVGKSVEVRNIGSVVAISGLHTFLLRSRDRRVCPGFCGYILDNEHVKQQIGRFATGLKVFGISKTSFAGVLIPLPPAPEQQAIVAVLSDMEDEISALEQRREKVRSIKIGMMQQLLTGQVRLLKPESVNAGKLPK